MCCGAALVLACALLLAVAAGQDITWVYPNVNSSCDTSTFTRFPFETSSVLPSALGLLLSPPAGILSIDCAQLAVSNLQVCSDELNINDGCCGTGCAASLNATLNTYEPGSPSDVNCFQQLINAVCYASTANPTNATANLQAVLFKTSLRCTTFVPVCTVASPSPNPMPPPAVPVESPSPHPTPRPLPRPHLRAPPSRRRQKPSPKKGCGKHG